MDSNYQKIFFFVMAGFEKPHYIEQIKFRKLQFKKYNILHRFLFENDPPEGYVMDENDLLLPKLPPIPERFDKVENKQYNPFMIQRFIRGLQSVDLSNYEFIVRVNISTFIHFKNFSNLLFTFPKKNVAAAHRFRLNLELFNYNEKNNPFTLFSGTCISMSKDLAEKLKTMDIQNPDFYIHNDDVFLTYFLDTFSRIKLNLPMWWCDANENPCPEDVMRTYSIIRIKHYTNPEVDIRQWKRCLKFVDDIDV